MDLKTFLILSGMLGVGYLSYNFIGGKTKISTLTVQQTRRISQEIKHQVMIVCIPYSKALQKIRLENKEKIAQSGDAALSQFRGQLSTIYTQKQNLILKKYVVTKQAYGASLQKHKKDKIINKNVTEIFDMLERAIEGKAPDFSIPKEASNSFTKQQLCNIYRDMVVKIGQKVAAKLREQMLKSNSFDPSNDDDFRKAVRELSIYDVKVEFLQSRGFKKQWGCPNQIFFKYLEYQKSKDFDYHKKVVVFEKTYEKVIEIVSTNPGDLDDNKIEKMFADAQMSLQKPTINATVGKASEPVLRQVSVPQVVKQSPPPPVQQNEDDVDLEKLMMQQLMNRSAEHVQQEPIAEKVAETEVEVEEVAQQQSQQKTEEVVAQVAEETIPLVEQQQVEEPAQGEKVEQNVEQKVEQQVQQSAEEAVLQVAKQAIEEGEQQIKQIDATESVQINASISQQESEPAQNIEQSVEESELTQQIEGENEAEQNLENQNAEQNEQQNQEIQENKE